MKALTNARKQTATYWGSPVNTGRGSHTYAAPVTTLVRWEYKREKFVNSLSEEEISMAVVMVGIDMDEGGFLYLGTSVVTNPETLKGAYPIKLFRKSPIFKATDFQRLATL